MPEVIHDCFLDALRADVMACGGAKAVGALFWPEKEAEGQRTSVTDRLNEARRERFTAPQQRLLMKRAAELGGRSAALDFICDAVGFERPAKKHPEDERATLLRDLRNQAAQLNANIERLLMDDKMPSQLRVLK